MPNTIIMIDYACHANSDSTMEALSDGHTVAPLIKVGYLHSRRGAKTYLFHFGYQTKDSEYPQVSSKLQQMQ